MTLLWFGISCFLLFTTVFNLLSGKRMEELLKAERKAHEEAKKKMKQLLWNACHQGEKVPGCVSSLVDTLWKEYPESSKDNIKSTISDKLYYNQFR